MAITEAILITRSTVGPTGPVEAGEYLLVPSEVSLDDAATLIRVEKAVAVTAATAKGARTKPSPDEPDAAAPAPSRTGGRSPDRTR